MSKRDFSKVPCDIFQWKNFREATDAERNIFLYYWINPHVDSTGCYYLPDGYACIDIRITEESYKAARNGLVERGLIESDTGAQFVRIPGWFEVNRPTGPQFAKGTLKRINAIKSDKLREATMAEFEQAGGVEMANRVDEIKKAKAQGLGQEVGSHLMKTSFMKGRR